jgi:tetratricopeptide (TPR) repeat protein
VRSLLIWAFAAVLLVAGGEARAAWHEATTKHFIIYADDRPDRLKEFAERLERFDRAVRYLRGMEDPLLTHSQKLKIYALKSEGAVARLAGDSSVRGFYNARASGAVAFVPRRAGSSDIWSLDTDAIFVHEYAHHLQLQFSSVAMPAWVVEGFAEFFATADISKDGSVLIGSVPMYRVYGLVTPGGITLEQMVGETYRRLDDRERDSLYGNGWLLTHYLTFDSSREGQLKRYIDDIQSGKTALDAAKSAFGDLKKLDRDVDRYRAKRLMGFRIPAKVLEIGPTAIRPLTPGESAIMDVHIRSTRGVNEKTAPAVATDARRIAAAFPNDPFVQAVLAEAEHDAGNYAASEAAADRALAVDPKNVHALIYKGRAEMALAKEQPAKADWSKIRGWFVKANKLDTENAEPLALFFRSYAEAGERPTKNAVEALLYSVDLAPQDGELRVNAVQQLLRDGRVSEAKQLFGPLAFAPHATAEWRETNMKIMAAINAGDAKTALGLMDGSQKLAAAQAKKP